MNDNTLKKLTELYLLKLQEDKERCKSIPLDILESRKNLSVVDSFIAFKSEDYYFSGIISEVYDDYNCVLVETKNGTWFIVHFNDIIWVRDKGSKWWPKRVYALLTNKQENEPCEST